MEAKFNTFRKAAMLRNNETVAEKILWQRLNKSQLGVRIKRQHPIENFIVDFYCHKAKLVIEIDEAYHEGASQRSNDVERDRILDRARIARHSVH